MHRLPSKGLASDMGDIVPTGAQEFIEHYAQIFYTLIASLSRDEPETTP